MKTRTQYACPFMYVAASSESLSDRIYAGHDSKKPSDLGTARAVKSPDETCSGHTILEATTLTLFAHNV
jgi:hypothetical protein